MIPCIILFVSPVTQFFFCVLILHIFPHTARLGDDYNLVYKICLQSLGGYWLIKSNNAMSVILKYPFCIIMMSVCLKCLCDVVLMVVLECQGGRLPKHLTWNSTEWGTHLPKRVWILFSPSQINLTYLCIHIPYFPWQIMGCPWMMNTERTIAVTAGYPAPTFNRWIRWYICKQSSTLDMQPGNLKPLPCFIMSLKHLISTWIFLTWPHHAAFFLFFVLDYFAIMIYYHDYTHIWYPWISASCLCSILSHLEIVSSGIKLKWNISSLSIGDNVCHVYTGASL